jgi:hypothetical protein
MRGADFYCTASGTRINVFALYPIESNTLLCQIEGRVTRGNATGKVYILGSNDILDIQAIATRSNEIKDAYEKLREAEPEKAENI